MKKLIVAGGLALLSALSFSQERSSKSIMDQADSTMANYFRKHNNGKELVVVYDLEHKTLNDVTDISWADSLYINSERMDSILNQTTAAKVAHCHLDPHENIKTTVPSACDVRQAALRTLWHKNVDLEFQIHLLYNDSTEVVGYNASQINIKEFSGARGNDMQESIMLSYTHDVRILSAVNDKNPLNIHKEIEGLNYVNIVHKGAIKHSYPMPKPKGK